MLIRNLLFIFLIVLGGCTNDEQSDPHEPAPSSHEMKSPPDGVIDTSSQFTYLEPDSISDLSPEIIFNLQADNCLVPKWKDQLGGVAVGEFAAEGQQDIAVICHQGDSSEIRIFWGGPASCDSRLPSFGQFIDTVDEGYIMGHYNALGGPKPPAITHQAINDHIVEKSSFVKYCDKGQWVELTGAD